MLVSCFPATLAAVEREIRTGQIERRSLGQTGEKLSMLGFGRFVLNESTPEQASEWVRPMAKRPWPKAANQFARNCWYEPMTDANEALMALRFTLSHPVTAALHPADPNCLKLALDLVPKFTPLTTAEADALKQKALNTPPLFRYPRSAAA